MISLIEVILYLLLSTIVGLVAYRLLVEERKDDDVDPTQDSFREKRAPRREKQAPRREPREGFDARGWTLLVDGSNFAHRNHYNCPAEVRLAHLTEVLCLLEQRFKHAEIRVYCDANLRYKLNETERSKFIAQIKASHSHVYETHGQSADEVILKYARQTPRCIVVSNDKFNKDDEPQWRVGIPLLKVNISSRKVRLPSYAELFQDPDRPFKRTVLPLRRLFST